MIRSITSSCLQLFSAQATSKPHHMLVFLRNWTFKAYLQTTNSSRPPFFTICSNAKIEYTAIHYTYSKKITIQYAAIFSMKRKQNIWAHFSFSYDVLLAKTQKRVSNFSASGSIGLKWMVFLKWVFIKCLKYKVCGEYKLKMFSCFILWLKIHQ